MYDESRLLKNSRLLRCCGEIKSSRIVHTLRFDFSLCLALDYF